MSTVASAITAAGALRLVADHGGKAKTPTELRAEAKLFEEDAFRRERLALRGTAAGSSRQRARALSRADRAKEQRANARVCRLAAKEIERRKVATVGQAVRAWPLRFLSRLMEKPTTD